MSHYEIRNIIKFFNFILHSTYIDTRQTNNFILIIFTQKMNTLLCTWSCTRMNTSDVMCYAAAKAGADGFDKLRVKTDGDTKSYI